MSSLRLCSFAVSGLLVALAACGDSADASGSGGAGSTGDATASGGQTATTSAAGGASTTNGSGGGATFVLPPPNAGLDYQLGGAYDPPPGVDIVTRDRNAPSAGALYDICYINGYQAQQEEDSFWLNDHPDLVLRDGNGDPIIDPDWDEMLLDITTPEKRAALADIVGGWIDGCAASEYEGVEIDNLDTYSRSSGLITEDDAVLFMTLLSARAHAAGLAIAQKNAAEIVGRRAEMGTDFAVAEECNVYDECDVYTGAYGDAVLLIEYSHVPFETGCANFPQLSIVLRDLDLVTPSDPGYSYDGC